MKTKPVTKPTTKPDLAFSGHGSVWLLLAQSAAGEAWVEEHIPDDAMTMGAAIAHGAMSDGLTVGRND
jgi:hypothetical protein